MFRAQAFRKPDGDEVDFVFDESFLRKLKVKAAQAIERARNSDTYQEAVTKCRTTSHRSGSVVSFIDDALKDTQDKWQEMDHSDVENGDDGTSDGTDIDADDERSDKGQDKRDSQ